MELAAHRSLFSSFCLRCPSTCSSPSHLAPLCSAVRDSCVCRCYTLDRPLFQQSVFLFSPLTWTHSHSINIMTPFVQWDVKEFRGLALLLNKSGTIFFKHWYLFPIAVNHLCGKGSVIRCHELCLKVHTNACLGWKACSVISISSEWNFEWWYQRRRKICMNMISSIGLAR